MACSRSTVSWIFFFPIPLFVLSPFLVFVSLYFYVLCPKNQDCIGFFLINITCYSIFLLYVSVILFFQLLHVTIDALLVFMRLNPLMRSQYVVFRFYIILLFMVFCRQSSYFCFSAVVGLDFKSVPFSHSLSLR